MNCLLEIKERTNSTAIQTQIHMCMQSILVIKSTISYTNGIIASLQFRSSESTAESVNIKISITTRQRQYPWKYHL